MQHTERQYVKPSGDSDIHVVLGMDRDRERSRSRERERYRDRSRSRSRERDREYNGARGRSRSRSRSRSPTSRRRDVRDSAGYDGRRRPDSDRYEARSAGRAGEGPDRERGGAPRAVAAATPVVPERAASKPAVDDRFIDEDDDAEEAVLKTSADADGAGDTAGSSGSDGTSGAGGAGDSGGPAFQIPEGMDDDAAMMAMMGFSSFDSTKGQVVADNQSGPAKGAARQVLQRRYRQYMNRRGGFARRLDAMK